MRSGRNSTKPAAWTSGKSPGEFFSWMKVALVSCSEQVPSPSPQPNGTFPAAPPPGSLHWASYSALHHELVHALLGFGIHIYAGGSWDFYTWFEIMSLSVNTDYPIPMSTYTRERCGLCTIRDMPRTTHLSLMLDSLETHSDAVRFQNGPIYCNGSYRARKPSDV